MTHFQGFSLCNKQCSNILRWFSLLFQNVYLFVILIENHKIVINAYLTISRNKTSSYYKIDINFLDLITLFIS